MNILSLQLGHSTTTLLMKDGKVLNVISQERMDNIKNSSVFPLDCIKYLLRNNAMQPSDINYVTISGVRIWPNMLRDKTSTSDENQKDKSFLYNLYQNLCYKYPILERLLEPRLWRINKKSKNILLRKLSDLGFAKEKIVFVPHHECHAASPAYFFPLQNEAELIFTLDGAGDYYSATVNKLENNIIQRLHSTKIKSSLGYVYSKTTGFLGMKPLEHEYKVMGLAAYAKPEYFEKTYEKVFAKVAWLNKDGSLGFDSKIPLNRFMVHLKKFAVGERFDNVAGALQYFTEQLVIAWIRRAIEKTGIKNIMTSGGVFMNVRLNKLIQEMPEVNSVRFMPSCGDESNVFGAAFVQCKKIGVSPKALTNIYLGHAYSNTEVEKFLAEHDYMKTFTVKHYANIEEKIAELLAQNKVVARFAGKAEFGARSLGNRAILANPARMESFYTVNDLIKQRDFWMPFAPSILDEDKTRYLKMGNLTEAPYMITAFDTTSLGREHLRAAMHQSDKTVRPQIVTQTANPHYYKLITKFKERTSIGAVLNTSLNIHGYPLAERIENALFTFKNSGLQYIALENYLISKNSNNKHVVC